MTNEEFESESITIGVLSLQGSYHEHLSHLENLFKELVADPLYSKYNLQAKSVKTAEDLDQVKALIIPGGESTTMSLLLQRNGLLNKLRVLVHNESFPCWGTCAGLILLANEVINTQVALGEEKYRVIGGLNVQVERNTYGRQLDSFIADVKLDNWGHDLDGADFQCVFIRGPVIKKILGEAEACEEHDVEGGVVRAVFSNCEYTKPEVLLKLKSGDGERIVAVRQGNVLGTSFHPELVTGEYRLHKWFIDEFVLRQ